MRLLICCLKQNNNGTDQTGCAGWFASMLDIPGLQMFVINPYLSHFVATKKNCLNEMVIMNAQQRFKRMNKKIITFS